MVLWQAMEVPDSSKKRKKLTIVDVAKRAGVSLMTVSRVINNMHGVSDATAARIRGLIDEMGYVPPPPAKRNRRIKGRRKEGVVKENITFMIPDTSAMAMRTPITGAITQGIAEVLNEEKIELVLSHLQRDGGLPLCIERGKVDGVIMRGALLKEELLQKMGRIPIVEVFDLGTENSRFDVVNPDVELGLFLGLEDLCSRGVRHAVFVEGEKEHSSKLLQEQEMELRKWAEDHGMELGVLTWEQAKSLDSAVQGLLFRAVIGWDLLHLLGNLDAQGRKPGHNIEVAVVDYAGFCPDTGQTLTMVDLGMQVVGAKAAERLLHRMREPDAPVETILVKPEVRRLD